MLGLGAIFGFFMFLRPNKRVEQIRIAERIVVVGITVGYGVFSGKDGITIVVTKASDKHFDQRNNKQTKSHAHL